MEMHYEARKGGFIGVGRFIDALMHSFVFHGNTGIYV